MALVGNSETIPRTDYQDFEFQFRIRKRMSSTSDPFLGGALTQFPLDIGANVATRYIRSDPKTWIC